MKNKNPEIDTGVQHEGQESNPANHQLLSQPQSKTVPNFGLRQR